MRANHPVQCICFPALRAAHGSHWRKLEDPQNLSAVERRHEVGVGILLMALLNPLILRQPPVEPRGLILSLFLSCRLAAVGSHASSAISTTLEVASTTIKPFTGDPVLDILRPNDIVCELCEGSCDVATGLRLRGAFLRALGVCCDQRSR